MNELLSSLTVAQWFIQKDQTEGRETNVIRVNKLTYLSHGWYLALTWSPLIKEQVLAGNWGPVFLDFLYRSYEYGIEAIREDVRWSDEKIPENVIPVLERVYEVYESYSNSQLSRIVNEEGGPWNTILRKNPERKYTNIPDDLIKEHFLSKIPDHSAK